MADRQRDVIAELLDHLGLDPAHVPAATLAAVRRTLDDTSDETPDPRALAAQVSRLGGYARPGHDGRRPTTSNGRSLPAEALEGLTPRELVDLLHPQEGR